MDTRKISFYRLKTILAIVWVIVVMIAFYGFTQKFSFGQLAKNVILKQQKLPLLVMTQGDNKAISSQSGFEGGRVVAANQNDFVFIGPYWPLLPGEYQVRWEIVPDCVGRLGQIDVVSRLEGSEYGKVELVGQAARELQIIDLDFTADFSWNYEFRMLGQNSCGFEVIKAELIRQKIDWKGLFNQTIGKFK